MSAQYRRALMYRHTLMNKGLTTLSNWFTDLHLTDMETGYKAINTVLLKSIPIRSNDFRFEVEITFKLAKRGARIFEVPIRYLPRTRAEGKKIGAKDGFKALFAMLHWALIDDFFQKDEYGTRLVSELEKARRYTLWLGNTIRPYVGDSVLEVGAGVASITNQLIPQRLLCHGRIESALFPFSPFLRDGQTLRTCRRVRSRARGELSSHGSAIRYRPDAQRFGHPARSRGCLGLGLELSEARGPHHRSSSAGAKPVWHSR